MQKKNKIIEYKRINSKKKLKDVKEYNSYLKDNNINYNDKVKKIIKKSNKKISKKEYLIRKIAVFGTMFVVIFCLLFYLIFKSKYFLLLKVNINNNNKSSYDDIILASDIKINTNIFKNIFLINNNMEKIRLKLPYIKDINIKLLGKHTLLLDVIERSKCYFVYDDEYHRYFILDKDGCILEEKFNINDKEEELFVSGITFDKEIILSEYINENDIDKLNIFEEIKAKFNDKFKNIKITKLLLKKGKYYIYLDDRIEVILDGNDNLEYNLNLLRTILDNINDIPGTIDMTKNNPTFVRFE